MVQELKDLKYAKEQIINPESSVVIQAGDILWVTGEQKRLRVVKRQLK